MDSPVLPDKSVYYYNSDISKFNTAFICKSEEELAASEHNVDAVLMVALRFPGVNITALQEVVGDLKQVYGLTRRKMERIRANEAAADKEDEPSPPAIASRKYTCLCPLTLLLRAIADIWNTETPCTVSSQSSPWGDLKRPHDILVELKDSLRKCDGKMWYPGLANCLLFHADRGSYTVVASAARYKNLRGLRKYALDVKRQAATGLLQQCSPESRARIGRIQSASLDLYAHFQKQKQDMDDSWMAWKNPFDNPDNCLWLGGVAATFSTIGEYKTSCLLDYYRMRVQRPPAAQLAEDSLSVEDRKTYPIESCAEYEMLVTFAAKT
ncbi:hypothetical protein CMQ_5343 [Grosmannia clavigera kw1407]|uniref:Uncharacterized protein n=1 Tax=Grosmannia clavigera (strain kw1407 / UAMH 11150) TaxID=655863 RepID=F0XBC7_GROCL|nr:uncharacterized protein CMQ_5343 [Grosmannia clavigera kw1407]EFX05081.1 hypothetical protein CMQ_5343 [Grosmannia clavigera kw1407]